MVKKLFGKAGKTDAGNDNIVPPHIPVASLLYFTGIPKGSKFSVLNDTLFLTHSEVSEHEDFLTAQAINIPARKKFGQLLKEFNHTCHTENRFLPIWQAGVGRFGVEDMMIINMLVRKSAKVPGQYEFGDFALYHPLTPSAADNIVRWAQTKKNPEPFLLAFGETVLKQEDLRELQAAQRCHITPATHEAVFHPNAAERLRIAFPHLAGEKPGGNTPSGP